MSYGGYGGGDGDYGGGYGGYGGNGGNGGDGGYGGYGGGGGGYSDYDGGAQNGGGFMNDAGSSQSPTKAGRAKGDKPESVVPVTIRVLRTAEEAPDNTFLVDGQRVSKVYLVGRILSMTVKDTTILFELDDGTGTFPATLWLEGNSDLAERFEQGMYVKVFGQFRMYNNKRSLSIYQLKPITDHNEVTHHFLEVIVNQLHFTKGPLNDSLPQNSVSPRNSTQNGPESSGFNMYDSNVQMNPAAHSMGGLGQPIQAGAPGGSAGDLGSMIMSIFNKPEVEELESGYSISQTCQELRSQGVTVTEDQVRKVVTVLSGEGHLYSTIDEEHYKSTGDAM